MNVRPNILFMLLIFGLGFSIAKKDDSNSKITKATRTFEDRIYRNVIREANEFFGNLSSAKVQSNAANAKLEELRNALTQPSNKSSNAIIVPSGWDKKKIVDALNKALNQNKKLQELSDKFNRLMQELKDLQDDPAKSKNKIKVPSELVPENVVFIAPNEHDNKTFMGRLIGFVKTGRHISSVQLSDLNPCSKGSCDKWKKGFENLRSFLSKSPSRLSELFKNFETLRKISEESAPGPTIDPNKIKISDKTKLINATEIDDSTREPVDYFDYYYNHPDDKKQDKKKQAPKIDKDIKISNSSKNVSASSSNNVLTGAQKVDYFDYYYTHGSSDLATNRTKFIGGKLGG